MNTWHLAGWLFADMLLVLALVAMGDQGDPLTAEQAAKANPSASSSASPSARPSRSPSPRNTDPRAVERKPVKVNVNGDAADTSAMVKQLRAVTAKYAGHHAAFVLTFGSNHDPNVGKAYAHAINTLLPKARPEMFQGTTTRDFIDLTGNPRHAALEIYFYTH